MPRTEEANQLIKEERRTKIIYAALKIFAHKGLTDTRITDIATATGMSQGLIYRYFASKDEVFAVLVEGTYAFMLDLTNQAKNLPGGTMAKLIWLTDKLLPLQYDTPEGALVLIHALVNESVPANVHEIALSYSRKVQDIIEALIREGQEDNQIVKGDSAQLAILYLATLHGLAAGASFLTPPSSGFPDTNMVLRFLRP